MTIKVGDRVPSVTFYRMTDDGPAPVTSDELFKGKRVALFALPGAFTPTCSAQHLPGYVAAADRLAEKGVDTIACVSVNDAFVMGAWGRDQKVGDKVLLLADGNGDFTRAVGLEFDLSARARPALAALLDAGRGRRGQVAAPGRERRARNQRRRDPAGRPVAVDGPTTRGPWVRAALPSCPRPARP